MEEKRLQLEFDRNVPIWPILECIKKNICIHFVTDLNSNESNNYNFVNTSCGQSVTLKSINKQSWILILIEEGSMEYGKDSSNNKEEARGLNINVGNEEREPNGHREYFETLELLKTMRSLKMEV